MLRRSIPVLGLIVVALTVLSIVADAATASPARRQARRNVRRGYYYAPTQQLGMVGQPLMMSPMQQSRGYVAYSRTPTADAPAGTVLLDVLVPANARVMIDGIETRQQGTERQFVSPQLDPNRQFTYKISATWTQNGQPVTRTRSVPVQAGQVVAVNLLLPTQEELRQPQQQRNPIE